MSYEKWVQRDKYLLCCFYPYNKVDNETQFVLECYVDNFIRDRFPALFQHVLRYVGLVWFFFMLSSFY
jgi:hypothetical protein